MQGCTRNFTDGKEKVVSQTFCFCPEKLCFPPNEYKPAKWYSVKTCQQSSQYCLLSECSVAKIMLPYCTNKKKIISGRDALSLQ